MARDLLIAGVYSLFMSAIVVAAVGAVLLIG